MTQPNKFDDLNNRFTSLGTGMTQWNKFEDLNGRFMSLGAGMTQRPSLGTGDGLYSFRYINFTMT